MSEDIRKTGTSGPDAVTGEWLLSVGFERSHFPEINESHYVLWCTQPGYLQSPKDLGVEVAEDREGWWNCWLRSDTGGRYGRLLYVRRIWEAGELVQLIEAVSGLEWN